MDLTGQKFGRLTAIRIERAVISPRPKWLCKCDCGGTAICSTFNLRSGVSTSCGCKKVEHAAKLNRSHGQTGTRTYKIWKQIRQRCFDPKHGMYYAYGAKGIVVCDGWKNSYPEFLADMGERPSIKHSIDRIDGTKNYSCGHCAECIEKGWASNCRWATSTQQNRNRNNNRVIEFQGLSLCLNEWAERQGIDRNVIFARLSRGWPVHLALTEKPKMGRSIMFTSCKGGKPVIHQT